MSDLVQDLINKRGDTTPPRQAIMKTYILQFMYRDGNGWAFVNATTPNQAEKVFKNQTKYVDARVIAIKETKWYGDSMQLVFEGAVTTFKNIDVTIDLATILRSTGQYKTLEDFLVNYLGLDNYYTKEEVDNKIDNIAKVDLTNYYTKKEINDKLKEMSLDGIEIDINDEGYWTINGVSTGKSAMGVPGAPGPVWSIGEDGYWYKDGVKQDYKAVGEFDFDSLSEEQREQLAGKGIANILANYALSTSNTTAPPDNSSAWSVSVKTPNASQKYLWAKFIFILTDNSRKIIGPFVLGNYAKDGTNSTGGGSSFNWSGKNYLACGDSLTDPSQTVSSQANKYCNLAAAELNMQLTNIGISGSTMCYKEGKSVASGNGVPRSFVHELLEGNTTASPESTASASVVGNNYQGPTNINWGEYDLITILLGTNDVPRMATNAKWIELGDENSTELYQFYHAYEVSIQTILRNKKSGAVLILCIPPKATANYYNIDKIKPVIKELGTKYDLPIIDFYSVDIELRTDGVHPTVAGQETMKQVLLNKLAQIAAQQGSGGGCNVVVVDDEAEAVDSGTLYFFDNSLLQGVGLYNTLLQQGWINLSNGEKHYYHPSNLYKRYDDGSFDILENNEEHGTEVIDNTVYYHYIDNDGLTKKSRTTMKYYGDIMVPHNIHLAETSDTAHLVMRVTGPFFAHSTPVTIHYDSSKVTVYEVTGVTSENVTAFSTQIKAYNSEKTVVADGSVFDFTYDNFINPRVLLVVRKYNTINDLKTSLNTTVTFSTPYENNVVNVSVMYGSCDIFYKKGTNYSVFENTSSSNITTLSGKDYFAAKDKCTVTAAVSRSLNQTKRNMFYVKIRNIPSKEPTLKATRDRRYYSDISSTLDNNIISFTLSDSYIVGRIKYLGLRLTGSYYKVKNVKIRKASGTETTVVTYTTNNYVTSSSPIGMKRDYFSTLEVGDTIKIQIEKTNESAFEYAVKFTDGECYFLTDKLGIAASSDSYIGAYYSSLVPRGGLNSILNDVTIFGSKVIAIPMTDIRVETIQANYAYNRPNADVLSEEDIITIDALKVLTDYDSPCCIEEIGVVTYDEYEKFST